MADQFSVLAGQQVRDKITGEILTSQPTQRIGAIGSGEEGQFFSSQQFQSIDSALADIRDGGADVTGNRDDFKGLFNEAGVADSGLDSEFSVLNREARGAFEQAERDRAERERLEIQRTGERKQEIGDEAKRQVGLLGEAAESAKGQVSASGQQFGGVGVTAITKDSSTIGEIDRIQKDLDRSIKLIEKQKQELIDAEKFDQATRIDDIRLKFIERQTELAEKRLGAELALLEKRGISAEGGVLGLPTLDPDQEIKLLTQLRQLPSDQSFTIGGKSFKGLKQLEVDEEIRTLAQDNIKQLIESGVQLSQIPPQEIALLESSAGMVPGSFEAVFQGLSDRARLGEQIDVLDFQKLQTEVSAGQLELIKEQEALNARNNGELSEDQFTQAKGLSAQVVANPAYRDMLDIETGILGVVNGLTQDTGFGDIAAINAFQRMVDPGATVRSEDVTLLQSASAFLNKIAPQFVIDRLQKGDKLPKETREQMRKTALELYDVRRNNFEDMIEPLRNLAESQGIDYGRFVAEEFKTSEELTGEVEAVSGIDVQRSFNDLGFDTSYEEALKIYGEEGLKQIIESLQKKNDTVSLNRPQRNKNPGNVKRGGVADQFAIKNPDGSPKTDDQGHLVFADSQAGFKGLESDLRAKVSGQSKFLSANPTIRELGRVYAEDISWANSVARILGVDINARTQSVNFKKLVEAVATQEGFFA